MTKKQISEIAAKVHALSEEHRAIERELKALKEQLKAVGSGQYGDYVVTVFDASRDVFKLKDAKRGLTKSVWEKVSQFVYETQYQVVKVVRS